MFHAGINPSTPGGQEIYSIYSGSLYGYSIQVHLGRLLLSDYGYGGYEYSSYDYGYDETVCGWRIHVTKSPGVDLTEEVAIDDDVTCLSVPSFEVSGVEGPAGCMGKIVLANFDKARLPYRAIERVWDFPSGYDYEGYPQQKIVELDPPCGEAGYGYGYHYGYGQACTQVCSRICLHGHRYIGCPHERVEFEWFEETGEDYYGSTLTRGWERYNPILEITERILLEEDDDGHCILTADMPQELPSVVVDMDRGCSCRLNELFWRDFGDHNVAFTVRCGFCSCWEFFCGTCRCVPAQLCVVSFIDGVFSPRSILTWDDETHCWENAGYGYGYGYSSYEYGYGAGGVSICLSADGDHCVMTLFIDGEDAGVDPQTLDCGDEMLERVFDPANDAISVTFAKAEGGSYLWVLASSLIQDCIVGPCVMASPCLAECGGHPSSVTVRLHAWSDPYEDAPYYDEEDDIEIVAHYVETWSITPEGPQSFCSYIGFEMRMCSGSYGPPFLVVTRVEIKDGEITVDRPGTHGGALTVPFETEECDPYYADTGVIITGLNDSQWGCGTETQRYQITVTE